MLAIGRALLSKPTMLMLDEPTEGVWIGVIEEIAERLAALAREISVIIVEQHLELALRVADYVYVMERGQIPLEGEAEAIRNDPALLRYLAPDHRKPPRRHIVMAVSTLTPSRSATQRTKWDFR